MSNIIDNSVVEMQFDNRQFESGIAQSLNSIQKLKESLNFSKSLDAFETISKSIKSVSFDPIVTIWQTSLTRMTNMAINAGQRITKALTIEPVFTGFKEYTTQIDAVQTILANTEKYGTSLNDVNKALDELNHYADKTIYNFTQMTSNIGRFTAAGVQLDPAVKSIEGMSNLAASSGATAEQASRAYYQMSQALAGIGLRLMDYNSLVNAGMGGQLFQEALKQTARDVKATTEEYAKLHSSGMSVEEISKKFGVSIDDVHKILSEGYNKDVDEAINKTGSFRESLSRGWATADILQRTFAKFSSTGMVEYLHMVTGASTLALEELQKIGQQTGFDSKEFNEYAKSIENVTEAQLEEIKANLKQAQTAEDAATKVRTFAQLKDTVKEAVQSGWTQTWEYIIGDFEQAKEFFTRISDYLGNIIGKYSDFRNKIVGDWSRGGGRKAVIEGLWNIVKIIEKFVIPLKNAWDNVFPDINVAAVLISVSKAFETLTERLIPHEDIVAKVQVIYERIFSVFESLRSAIGNLIHLVPKLENALSGSLLAGIFNTFENKAYASYRGGLIGYFQKLYGVISDISDMEIKIPGMESEGKSKLADYKPYQKMLSSLSDFWSGAQGANISKFVNNTSDIEKLNDALLKMAFGIENGNKVVSKFSSTKRDDFLTYLQEEYGLELEVAEDIYRLVDKLNGVETDIVRMIELSPMKELLSGDRPGSASEVIAKFIGDILGVDMYTIMDAWDKVQRKINNGLRRLAYTFNDTITVLKTLDSLLGALVYISVTEIGERVVKPMYLFMMKYFAPALMTMYDAIQSYALPALDAIVAGFLVLLKLGLENIFDNFSSRIDKMMPVLEIFGMVLAIISNTIANSFYDALKKLAGLNPDTLFWDLGQAIKDWFASIDTAFKQWAGFSIKDVIDNIIGDVKWVWTKIDNAFKITDRFGKLKSKIDLVLESWKILLKNGVVDLSEYVAAFGGVFGSIANSNLGKLGSKIGNGLYSVYSVFHGFVEAFKEFVDNPNSLSIPDRINVFVDKIGELLFNALELNGLVNGKFAPAFNALIDAVKLILGSLVSLIPIAQYATAGIRPVIANMFGMLKEFASQNGLDVKNILTVIVTLIVVLSIIRKLMKSLNSTAPSFYEVEGDRKKGLAGLFDLPGMISDWFFKPVRDTINKLSKCFDLWTRATATLDNLNGAINAFKHALKIGEIVAVAAAIVLMTGSIYLLATIPAEKLISVVSSLGVLFAELGILLMVITKGTSNLELGGVTTVFAAMAAMLGGIAALLYVYDMIEAEGRDPSAAMNNILKLVAGLAGILTVFTIVGNILGRLTGGALRTTTAASASIYAIAKALLNLAPAIWVLSNVPADKFGQVMKGLLVIFGGMTAYAWAAGKFNAAHPIEAAVGIIGMSIGLMMIVGALKSILAVADNAKFGAAIGLILGIQVLFLAMLGISYVIGDNAATIGLVALAMISMAASVLAVAAAIAILVGIAGPDVDKIQMVATALISVIAVFALFGVALGILSAATGGTAAAVIAAITTAFLALGAAAAGMGIGLLGAGAGLLMIASALEKFGQMLGFVKSTTIQGISDVSESLTSDLIITITKFLANFNTILIEIINFLENILPEIGNAIDIVLNFITERIPGWTRTILEHIKTMLEMFKELIPPIQELLQTVIKAVLDSLIPYLKENLPPWLEDLKPVFDSIDDFILTRIDDFLVRLKEHAGPIADSLLTIVNDILTKVLEPVNAPPDDLYGPPEAIKTRIEEIAEKLAQLLAIIFAKIPKAFLDVLPELTDTLTSIAQTVVYIMTEQLVGSLAILSDIILSVMNKTLDEYGPKIIDGIKGLLEKLKKFIEEDLPMFWDFVFEMVVSGLQYIATALADMVAWPIHLILLVIYEALKGIQDILFEVFWGLIDLFKRLFLLIIKLIIYFLSSILTVISALLNGILDTIIEFLETDAVEIINKLDQVGRDIIDLFILFVNNLATTIEEKGPELNDAFTRLVSAIVEVIKDGIQKIFTGDDAPLATFLKVGTDIVSGIIDGISDKWNALFGKDGKLTKLVDKVKEILSLDEFKSIGENIVQGLINGITGMKETLKTTVSTVFGPGTGVLNWIKDALDEDSPSKATKEMGVFVDKGFENGLLKERSSMLKTVDEVFGEGTGVMEGIRDAVGVHSDSWKTEEYAEDVGGGFENGTEDSEPGMLAKVGDVFGNVMDKIKGIFKTSEEGDNPISNILGGFIGDWDPDKGLVENLKNKVSGLFGGENGILGEGGLFGGLLDGLTGEGGLFAGFDGIFDGLLKDENGESIFGNLFGDIGDPKWLSDMDYDSLATSLGGSAGETLSDGRLDTSVAKANDRTITSSGSYANAMNDMVNSGQYWNDQNALTNADIVNAIATVVQRLDNIDENMPKEVVLDTGAMVGNLSPEMNKALGRMLRQKGRRG